MNTQNIAQKHLYQQYIYTSYQTWNNLYQTWNLKLHRPIQPYQKYIMSRNIWQK